jgi:hypothetical protein
VKKILKNILKDGKLKEFSKLDEVPLEGKTRI